MGGAASQVIAAPAELDAEARAAERARIADERFAHLFEDQRSWSYCLAIVLFCATLCCLAFVPAVERFLRIPPLAMLASMTPIAAAVVAATVCARSFGGVLGRAHRVAERIESATIAVACAGLIYASGDASSFFWFLVVAHLLNNVAEVRSAAFLRGVHGASLGALSLAFAIGGRYADAALVAFAVAVALFIAKGQARFHERALELEVERNLLRRRVESLVVARERRRIARDLHDGLGAELAAVAWTADALLVDDAPAHEQLRELSARARRGLTELRSVVVDLKASDMALPELAAAMERSCAALVPQGCAFVVEARGQLALRAEPCAQLGMMIREAVRNAAQHADARRIGVVLDATAPMLEIRIEDDGRGMPASAASSDGGVSHLRERAESIGARLEIVASSAGTAILVRVDASAIAVR